MREVGWRREMGVGGGGVEWKGGELGGWEGEGEKEGRESPGQLKRSLAVIPHKQCVCPLWPSDQHHKVLLSQLR